ncbi:MAG: PfkB family carbohydrate kinase [Chloroflexota bacterium]
MDILQSHNEAGGSGLNVAVVAARLGGSTALVAAIGNGRYGQSVWEEMGRSGVDKQFIRRIEGSDGNLLIILTRENGDWVVMQENDPRVQLSLAQLPSAEEMAQYKIVHIDGFSYIEAEQRNIIEAGIARARAAGCLVSIDTAVPTVEADVASVIRLFQQCNILFLNAFEAQQVTEEQTTSSIIAHLRQFGASLVVLKWGEQGSWLITPDAVLEIPAFQVEVVDSIAAGDSYAGAFLLGLCQGRSLIASAQSGSAAGAMACLGIGSLSHRFNIEDLQSFISTDQTIALS